ncbi:Phospholipase/carboxylesterase/thioesterase [Butyriboletus roseoflavus]|nr:Phospholipase/carboxylesterase/thioesterase [Butyriboletus roseoflavus]
MRAWYNLSTLDLKSDPMDDESGMLETVWYLDKLIQQEVDTGIPSSRIALMGFSQGAGMTLLTALTGGKTRGRPKEDGWKLAGIAPLGSKFKSVARKSVCLGNTHLLGARRRGHNTDGICAEMLVAEMSARKLGREELGSPGLCFVTYGGLAHSINDAELEDLRDFVEKIIPVF